MYMYFMLFPNTFFAVSHALFESFQIYWHCGSFFAGIDLEKGYKTETREMT